MKSSFLIIISLIPSAFSFTLPTRVIEDSKNKAKVETPNIINRVIEVNKGEGKGKVKDELVVEVNKGKVKDDLVVEVNKGKVKDDLVVEVKKGEGKGKVKDDLVVEVKKAKVKVK